MESARRMAEMEEEDGGSTLFSSKPKTFTMERHSPQASSLKASVLHKLLDFLDNYTDDDLAEYIVVLVCNGKNQNQTRDDLEEFLGDDSGRFVSWLWNHLSSEMYLPKAPFTDSVQGSDSKATNANNVDKEHKTNKKIKIEGASPSPNIGSHGVSNISSHSTFSNHLEESEDLQCPGPKDSLSVGLDSDRSNIRASQIHKISGMVDYDSHQTKGAMRSEIRSFVDIPTADIKRHSPEDDDGKVHKTEDESSQYERFSHKKELASRSFKSAIAVYAGISNESGPPPSGHAVGKPLSKSLDQVQCEDSQSRRSVWDRLGKPSGGRNLKFNSETEDHASNPAKKKRTHTSDVEGEGRLEGLNFVPREVNMTSGEKAGSVKNCTKVMAKRRVNETEPGGNIGGIKAVNHTMNLKRRCHPILNDQFPVPESENHSSKFATITSNRRTELAITTPVGTSVSGINSSAMGQENAYSEAGKSSNNPSKSGILDLSSQLKQVQKELLELRSKQAQIFKSAKSTSLTGSKNHHEDIDSRTAFVSNVHFAATRESLSLHFSKCGPVAKVTILIDMLTGHPKGCAYIAFTNKDSLEKAILLDGTSFMSRALKVIRKAEMPEGVLEHGLSSPQAWNPQFHWKSPSQRKHPTSHLQWRRE